MDIKAPRILPQFPPLAWLGYGLDLTRVDPFDFQSVASAKTSVRIVDITKDKKRQTVEIGDVSYEIPKVVSASPGTRSQSTSRTFLDGTLAVKELQDDPTLASSLFFISATDKSIFPPEKSLPKENRFYFFGLDHDGYSGQLRNYIDLINEDELLKYVSKLSPFNPQNPEVVQAYTKFFNVVGSHFISYADFGGRFQLEVWASNKHKEVNENFQRDITASVMGLNNGGEYDKDALIEPQYLKFDRLAQRIVRVRGGNTDLANALVQSESPDLAPAFKQWWDSIQENNELVTLTVSEVWSLLRNTDNKKLRESAKNLQEAFGYFSSLRRQVSIDKHTWITFEMTSDWAEFGILTPSAVVRGGDSDQVVVPPPMVLGPAKLRWGSSGSPTQHLIVVLEVINDGTPIDIYLRSGSGTAMVYILGQCYTATGGYESYTLVPVTQPEEHQQRV